MKRIYLVVVSLLLSGWATAQNQQILLLFETFDHPTNVMQFDGVNPDTVNYGINKWTIDSSYKALPFYPNTPGEDSVFSGTINGAPHSRYLHIHDSIAKATNGVSDANWNTNAASDRFCHVGTSFCTLGYSNTIFTFFWIAGGYVSAGDTDAYGEVYYRVNGGKWKRTGRDKYYDQPVWKYEIIQDTGFNNKENVEIGFRWVNKATGRAKNLSWGIDDLQGVGNFNPADTVNSSKIKIFILDNVYCQGEGVLMNMTITKPLCDGTYDLQLSKNGGSFTNPYDLGILSLGPDFTSGNYISLATPGTVTGNCFRIRVVRTNPEPVMISDTSACFTIQKCVDSIFNVDALVLHDADTACNLSVIDVTFNSIGVYQSNNDYIAEISDSTGSFEDSTFVGHLAKKDSFPSIPPGSISGLIPASLPAGCGYYLRVRSTHPVANLAPPMGPFCIVHCDELTNNHEDLHFCATKDSNAYPLCDTLRIQPHYWDNLAHYDTCNKWQIELRSQKDFSLVSLGDMGIYHDTTGGYYQICVPSTKDSLPVAPGSYYMRLRSNCSNEPWNQNGTLVRFSIGAPNPIPPTIAIDHPVVCRDSLKATQVALTIVPYDQSSQYEWAAQFLFGGQPFEWPGSTLNVRFDFHAPLGDNPFYVHEINYGCDGPSSKKTIVKVVGPPVVDISGRTQVCIGDTSRYKVTFLPETYYSWDAPFGITVLDKANSEATMIFDSIGSFFISNVSINSFCNSKGSGTYKVKVVEPYFQLDAGTDQQICQGDTATLHVETNDLHPVFTSQDSARKYSRMGGMFNIIPHFDVTIDSFAVRVFSKAKTPKPFDVQVYGRDGGYLKHETLADDWFVETQIFALPPASSSDSFTIIPAPVLQFIPANDTFGFYITSTDSTLAKFFYNVGSGLQGDAYKSDGVIDFIQGTVLEAPFYNPIPLFGYVLNVKIYYTSKGGFSYVWNNGETNDTIRVAPTDDFGYQVAVSDHANCTIRDKVNIVVKKGSYVYAGPDTTLCAETPYQMKGVAVNSAVEWFPSIGLSNDTSLNATFNFDQSTQYVLVGKDDSNGCFTRDTVDIKISKVTANVGDRKEVCFDSTFTIPATASSNYRTVIWTPGDGLSATDILQPIYDPNATNGGVYTLIVTDSIGCKASSSAEITSGCPAYLTVPQAFTPNGDGTNDYFIVYSNVRNYQIRIFNRWGEMVFESHDLNYYWDGRYKGTLQETGTFVYYASGTDDHGKKVERKGNLTLIR